MLNFVTFTAVLLAGLCLSWACVHGALEIFQHLGYIDHEPAWHETGLLTVALHLILTIVRS